MKRIILLAAVFTIISTHFSQSMAQADQCYAGTSPAIRKLIAKANAGDAKSIYALACFYETGAGVPLDSIKALQLLQKAASLGNGEAALASSRYYLTGTGVPKDTARYLAIRQEWANKKYPNGIAALGLSMLHGMGVTADTVRGLELLRQADAAGSSWAAGFWGTTYAWGEYGVPKDWKMAEKYYKKAIKLRYDEGAENIAYFYAMKDDFKSTWKYLDEALKTGSPFARVFEAQLRFNGSGVTKDEAMALKLIDGVLKDFPNYRYALGKAGQFYLLTSDVALRDSLKAVALWQRGVDLNSNESRYYLTQLLINNNQWDNASALLQAILDNKDEDIYKDDACVVMGNIWRFSEKNDAEKALEYYHLGVDRYKSAACARALAEYYAETEEADEYGLNNLVMSYYMKAYELGDTAALLDYGKYCAYNGDYEHAEEAFNKMVAEGNCDGYYWLAAICSSQNQIEKMLSYLQMGDKKGNVICRQSLGSLYEEGYIGNQPDYKKAEKYYLSAASANSYNQLGLLYLTGSLGKQSPKDMQKGLSYLEKSAHMGYIDAIYRLGYFYETGTVVDSIDHVKALSYYRLLAAGGIAAGYFKMGLYYELGDGGLPADSSKALHYYTLAADKGYGEAMCYLGDFYRIGQYCPLDREKAFEYYSKADSVGSSMGTYYVGRSFLEGCGVPIDSAAAVPYLKAAAAQGVGNAAYHIAEFYNYGKGSLPSDADSALRYYVAAYQNGNTNAAYPLGLKVYNEGDYQQSFNLIYQAARGGNPDAIVRLAAYVQEGIGTQADPEQAYQLFEIAARRHNMPAAYSQLGLARLQGNGCRQDEVLGKLYLDTAASMGSNAGMFYLALCYINGYGCEPDSVEGDGWLRRSAMGGYVRAMNLLGDRFENAEVFDSAVFYFQMAADRGSWDGLCNMGYCYEKGQGVKLSFKKAIQYYRAAADDGSPRGMRMLANCYLEGIGVDKDVNQVISLLEKASGTGDVQAMYYLGLLYEDGDDGFPKDMKKAKQWLKKAAEAGFKPAQEALLRF